MARKNNNSTINNSVNNDTSIVKRISLGVNLADSCYKDIRNSANVYYAMKVAKADYVLQCEKDTKVCRICIQADKEKLVSIDNGGDVSSVPSACGDAEKARQILNSDIKANEKKINDFKVAKDAEMKIKNDSIAKELKVLVSDEMVKRTLILSTNPQSVELYNDVRSAFAKHFSVDDEHVVTIDDVKPLVDLCLGVKSASNRDIFDNGTMLTVLACGKNVSQIAKTFADIMVDYIFKPFLTPQKFTVVLEKRINKAVERALESVNGSKDIK